MIEELIKKLDLAEYVEIYKNFLARPKPIFLDGDLNVFWRFLKELEKFDFSAPPKVKNLQTPLAHLQKIGVLHIDEIYEFVKIIRYFLYLKTQKFENSVHEWIEKIEIPAEILKIEQFFNEKGEIKEEIDDRLKNVNRTISKTKDEIRGILGRVLATQKLAPYLVDRQIHFINGEETLLVRGGFNHVLKAIVTARSAGGFFYVLPEAVHNLKRSEADLMAKKEEIIYEHSKIISSIFTKFLKFLKFIDREFDKFDSIAARLFFARAKDYEFVLPRSGSNVVISSFSHPALHKPKPINVDFSKNILIVTGVNAGGKTMLLKSILSSAFLAKYLLPMKINATDSKIPIFKEISPVIDDPQNVKNDISTFAGRMVEFGKLFGKERLIVGIDEIELGTDSDEAASLFKAILDKLASSGAKIIATTHHKRLAAMMAGREDTELMAAIYNEAEQKPTYEFLKGTIGKSYAFETAARYGIPYAIVKEARIIYGEDKERLNEAIQKSLDLELELKLKKRKLDEDLEKVSNLKEELLQKKEILAKEFDTLKANLEKKYSHAIEEAKNAAKLSDQKEIHKALNVAHSIKKEFQKPKEKINEPLSIGDYVKFGESRGVILNLSTKEAFIESDTGMRVKIALERLKKIQLQKTTKSPSKVIIEKPQTLSVKLDLHGLRADEAIEKLDKFISDSLMGGFDEVLIFHGIGTGKLAYAVKEFLKIHPKVISFHDAPPQMGGYGATVAKF